MNQPDVSIVLGSLNRKRLLKQTIKSIRENGFKGSMEIIVVDGGSTDGTCDWLSMQKDIFTIIQPNYMVDGSSKRAHSWGEFINIGFKRSSASWILMISDDLLLCENSIQLGLDELMKRKENGEKIGGGAFYWREYPIDRDYHVKLLPNKFVLINHGFFYKEALEDIGYANETDFNFYGADSDLSMRLNLSGWKTVDIESSYAEHLKHRIGWRRKISKNNKPTQADKDLALFYDKYKHLIYKEKEIIKKWKSPKKEGAKFWKIAPYTCMEGLFHSWLRSKRILF